MFVKPYDDNKAVSLYMAGIKDSSINKKYKQHSIFMAFLYSSRYFTGLFGVCDPKKEWIEANKRKLFIILLLGLSFGQGLLYMGKGLNEYSPYHVYQTGYLSSYNIAEYLPANSSDEGRISVAVLAGFAGNFKVEFNEPWY